jgi:hypothetical protein
VTDKVVFDDDTLGHPRQSLRDVPDGDYYVQAEFKLYDTYVRGDGETLVLPKSCVAPGGDGSYGLPTGHLFSDPQLVHLTNFDSAETGDPVDPVEVLLSHKQPALPGAGCAGVDAQGQPVANSRYIRTVNLRSEPLSKFWGREVTLQACVLLPFGHDDPAHANATYPLVVAHSHYRSIRRHLLMPGVWCLVPLVTGVSGVWCLVSGVWLLIAPRPTVTPTRTATSSTRAGASAPTRPTQASPATPK